MSKIIGFLLFFNLILIQNTFAKEEKTIFGFSLEFPSSKYVVLKEQNELTIKEFLKQNGYRDYKRITRENEFKDLTTNDVLKLLYKEQQDKNGKQNGKGIYANPSGLKYVGEFKDDKFHGKGTVTLPGGEKYVGEWKENKRHGQGKYIFPDGRIVSGEYKEGKFIK